MKRIIHLGMAFFVILLFAASLQSCITRRDEFNQYPTSRTKPHVPGEIRVLLAGEGCMVSVSGGYEIRAGKQVLFQDVSAMPEVDVAADPAGLRLGTQIVRHQQIEIIPSSDGTLLVNGNQYRGKLRLVKHATRGLMAVNVLPLENYLYGVVAAEMPSFWPPPALRAQAIASRTYMLHRTRQRANWDYDVVATTADQVYRGVAGETNATNKAVDDTRGAVLLYDYQFVPAHFHSICGGRTANRQIVFNEPDITPLSGVDCPYCHPDRHGVSARVGDLYRWQAVIPERAIIDALAKAGHRAAAIQAIEPVRPGPGGHAGEVEIKVAGGAGVQLRVDEFRSMIGYGKLTSSSFVVRKQGGDFIFSGRGFGHGVGLCQWGARGMANAGSSSITILEYYYPGAGIVKLY